MRFDNQLRNASAIIGDYQGNVPLHTWLKEYFRDHPQMGSKDRRITSHMVYGFYRLGHSVRELPTGDRILLGLFLCQDTALPLLDYFRPDWNERTGLPIMDKIDYLRKAGIDFYPEEIFPWKEELSEGIDHTDYCLSFLQQPALFLRIRPGWEEFVLGKNAGEFIPPFTLRLPNGFKVEEFFTPDKEVVVQDYSSQRLATFLETPGKKGGTFWDACAASGGKSILAFDLHPGLNITVSDVRESILHNLHQRFRQAGIKSYTSFTADLTVKEETRLTSFDMILADVPCSGSGTWSRTPEELYFFNPARIGTYSVLQKKILANLLSSPRPGTSFVYSTCSVFRRENEEAVAFIRELGGKDSVQAGTIPGYGERADSMFAARFLL